MKICLPVLQDQGVDSFISGHFGSAPFFLIIDSNSLQTKIIPNKDQHHAHGMCQPLAMIGTDSFDAIVVSGMGAGALNKLNNAGKKVYKTELKTVKETLDAINAGKLVELTPQATCSHQHAPHSHSVKGIGPLS